ncbi:MAG: DUF86 domain-containing protein [Trueperaceae bacterium]|nr:DUF86 domain-containing protein [Trueperaceae bacterium]
MPDDVRLNKAATIERCLARVREEYGAGGEGLDDDLRRQDALVLNLLRVCETAIDLAMHLVRREALGVPQSSRDAFDLLAAAGVIEPALATALRRMVGFRNLAVHRYQELDLAIVGRIVEERLVDFEAFVARALAR